MKKFLSALVCAVLVTFTAFGLSACNKTEEISVYMPDGAPALSMAVMMNDNGKDVFGKEISYNVVDSAVISSVVTGENPKADLCILPVNLASKLLGSGETYKMLGTVTHGNLYLLKKASGEDITLDNISVLKGKTVGVIQLANVPGLTFKAILNDNALEYAELGNDGSVDENKVNLKAVAPETVLPSDTACDYFVVPEPAATTKVNATHGALSFAGSLQTLYGSDNGYPQAVLVAKTSLIESDSAFINKFIDRLSAPALNLWHALSNGTVTAEEVVNVIGEHLSDGLSPSFTAANLNKDVIKNCAVNFVTSKNCKDEVNSFLTKLIAVNASSANTVSDAFYYTAE